METSIAIRQITGIAEMRAVENLQKEVWGIPDLDVVPLSQLTAAAATGGVLLGAFDAENLVGFAYGFVGCEHGKTTHHSHMLAVKPAYRSSNLGAKLKWAQREYVLRQGITEMSWTFDPLQSLNAYFNFDKLGVVSDRYIVDFYGTEAASFLHRNSTDRLWATWRLDSARVLGRIESKTPAIEFENVRRLVKFGEDKLPQVSDLPAKDERAAIEIPSDINELQAQNGESAVKWREATRRAFVAALKQGCIVREFCRINNNYGAYLLTRDGGKF